MQYADDVSQNYILETHIILLTNVTPININNKKEDMNEKRPVSKQEKTAEWKL